MQTEVAIHHIEAFRALDAAGTVAGIWSQANDLTDDDARAFLSGTIPKHVRWPGFSLYLAAIEGNPVGFVYGYLSAPGQWWHDQVAPALRSAQQDRWLEAAIELAEIAVLPQFQRRGIGSRLLDAFLSHRRQRVVLSLEASDASTHRLYRTHGFTDLVEDFRYDDWPDDPMIIMGRGIPEENAP